MIHMLFSAVRVSALGDVPVLLLREASGSRSLAIWINAAAGAAILSALEAEEPGHPSTHDLIVELLATQDAVIEAVHLLGEEDGVYKAELVVSGTAVTCRVSDGVALALRCGAPIYAVDALLDACVPAEGEQEAPAANPDDQLEQFREFLDRINPDDFENQA